MFIGHPLDALAVTHDRGRELRAQAASRRGRASKMRRVLALNFAQVNGLRSPVRPAASEASPSR